MIEPGDNIEYAVHPVVWQATGEPLPIDEEEWLRGECLAVKEHAHIMADHLPEHEQMEDDDTPDTVVTIQPDSGEPPLDLNIKLVRKANRKAKNHG